MIFWSVELRRCVILCIAYVGFSTPASSQNIQVIDLGLEILEGSGDVPDTFILDTSQPAAYTLKPSEQSTPSASSVLENVTSSPILSGYISTSFLEHITSRRDTTAFTSVEDSASYAAQVVALTSAISSDVSSARDDDRRSASTKSSDVYTTLTISTEFQLFTSTARSTQNRTIESVYLAPSESHTQFSHDTVTPTLHILNTDLSHLTVSAFQSNDDPLRSTQTTHVRITNSPVSSDSSTFPYRASDLSASIEEIMSHIVSSSSQQGVKPSTIHKSGIALSTPTIIDLFPSSLPASDSYLLTRASMISEELFSTSKTIVMPDTEIYSPEMSLHSSLAPTRVSEIISATSKAFPISSELSLWQIKLSPSGLAVPLFTSSLVLPVASVFDNETSLSFSHDLERTQSPATLSTLLSQEGFMSSETVASELTSQNSSQVSQVETTDFSSTSVDFISLMPSSTNQNIESLTPGVSFTEAVRGSIVSQIETPDFSSTTVGFTSLMPSSTNNYIEILTPAVNFTEAVRGSIVSQIETPDFSSTTVDFTSLKPSSTNQNIVSLTPGVSFTEAVRGSIVSQIGTPDFSSTTVDFTSLMPSSTNNYVEILTPAVNFTEAVRGSIASQIQTPDFSSTSVDSISLKPSSTNQNIESSTPGVSIAEAVGGSISSQIETPDFRFTTLEFASLLPSSTNNYIEILTPRVSFTDGMRSSIASQVEFPDFRSNTMEFTSIMSSSTNQYTEILTPGASFIETANVSRLRSSDIFDIPQNASSDKSNMGSPSFFAESTVPFSMKPSSTTHTVSATSLGTGLSYDFISDVNIASLSYVSDSVVSRNLVATVSSLLTSTPTLSMSDLHASSTMELNTSGESFVLSLVDPSVSLSATSDVGEMSRLKVSLRSSEQISFIPSSTHTVSGSIFRDISILTSNVIPYLTTAHNPTPSQQISVETFQLFTSRANLENETRSLSSSIIVGATSLNVSVAFSLPTDAETINATPTISSIAEQVSSVTKSETSMVTVKHSSLPNTTSPVPEVAALTDVTFAFSFTVDGQCLTLRQVPYSRHLKTSLARILLYLTRLKMQTGTKVRVGEAQCNTKPHVISVSFFKVNKHSLLQVLNSTHVFYGKKHKRFSRPIVVKFSAETKTFVVKITGFEEIEKLGRSRSHGSIFGLDTAAIATAACLCVVLFCVGTCIFAREAYLKRRADCMNVSGRSSPALTFKIKAKAAELTHTTGMYRGSKTGIDNPTLCSSVYNDLEMTEVHLGDTDDDDDSSYYNPYDVEYSSIGNNYMVEFDAFGASGNLRGIMNSAFSLSSVEDDSKNCTINDHSKNGALELEKQAIKSPSPLRNYGLVIGLLGYNKQQVRQPRQEEKTSSWSPEERLPNASYRKPQRNHEHKNQGDVLEENIYAVPMKYPRKSRQNSRKRPSLRAMMSGAPLTSETSLSLDRQQKPSPVPPPRRQKNAARSHQEHKIAKHGGRGKAETQTSVKAQRSVSRDDVSKSGRVNRSFVEDEGYAAISGSTQSFHF